MDVLTVPADRDKSWYLSLMAPNTKGPKFAWLDPSRLYCNSQALADCVKDLLTPFHNDTIDLVAGIDAMGFILGASVATTLGKGFLAIRKAGHLCVETHSQQYSDYSGREKTMEVRLDVLKPGYFFTGDGACRSKEGYYQIIGGLDDVINVSGHRIGTAELEDVLNQCPWVAESAVIGYTHDIKGQGVYAFVVLKKEVEVQEADLTRQLRDMVSKSIAKYACPDFIQFVRRLPKTRSGKIMRRVLRKVVERDLDGLGDLSTMDDPAAVQEVIQGHRDLCGEEQPQR